MRTGINSLPSLLSSNSIEREHEVRRTVACLNNAGGSEPNAAQVAGRDHTPAAPTPSWARIVATSK